MSPPPSFFLALIGFHLFPLHAPITLLAVDAPFGKFSSMSSKWNVPGNLGWCIMELVSPTTFLATLAMDSHPQLTTPSTILAGLYLYHYAHRAIISPLILSPKRSPLHITIPFAAAVFNLLNGYLLATGLAFYPPQEIGWTFWVGVVGWAAGFFGNVYHDEILNDLRRPPEERLVTYELPEDDETSAGRYKIPRGGLFRYVSSPNYLCEWCEWTFFSLAASPYPLIALPPLSELRVPSIAADFVAFIAKVWWPSALLSPGWMFVLAEVTAMLPRAVNVHRWYVKRFGDKYPKGRKAAIPGVL